MEDKKNYKMLLIYINESHKQLLEKFFEEIRFYYYTVQKKVESVWSEKLKHKNTHIWPGTDCLFMLTLREDKIDDFLVKLKTFRASLPYQLVMSVGIIPLERTIPDLLKIDLPVDEQLLEQFKSKIDI